MKRIFLFAALLLLFINGLHAATWTDANGVTWTYFIATANGKKQAELTKVENYGLSVVVPDSVTDNGVNYPAYRLSQTFSGTGYSAKEVTFGKNIISLYYTFSNNSSIEHVYTPADAATITTVTYPFSSCSNLRTVDLNIAELPNEIFSGKTNLQEVLLSGPTVSIGTKACYNCSNLWKINIPSTVTTIKTQAFSGCTSLDIRIPSNVVTLGENAFKDCKYVRMESETPPTLTSANLVGTSTFVIVPDVALDTYRNAPYWSSFRGQITSESSLNLREVTVTATNSGSALSIALGESNLLNTTRLKIHGTINSYDIMTIRNKMVGLRYLDMSDAEIVACSYEYVTGYCSHNNVLEQDAFSGTSLQVVKLPKNLTRVTGSFHDCSLLDSVFCQEGLQTIGSSTFSNCSSLKYINLPNTLKTIGGSAFYQSGLEEITIPASVQSIGTQAFAVKIFKSSSFYYCYPDANNYYLRSVVFEPNSRLTSLNSNVFAGQANLESIVLPDHLQTIGSQAFAACYKLVNSRFPKSLRTIDSDAFNHCTSLDTIVLPPRLETISSYAFYYCTNLDVIKISSGIRTIGNYAFGGCPNVSRVYTYTVEPTNINQNTFSSWQFSTLYVPRTSYYNYYYNTQWSQFIKICEFDEDYDYFYLNGDYYLGGDHGTITGNPDIDLNPGSGLIIEGEDPISAGTLNYFETTSTGTSIISNNNLNVDTLNISIVEQKDKWHFLTFPYNTHREDVNCNSEFVIRYYDGATRAQMGNGGWKNVPMGTVMKNGQGYIFQSKTADTLRIKIANPVLPSGNVTIPLQLYAAANPWDANWNMVGNPYMSYYDMDSIRGFTYPIIVWNGKGYDTYRPGDDTYHMVPLEGFFIQNASLSSITFDVRGRETRIQMNDKKKAAGHVARRMPADAEQGVRRQLINLSLADSSYTDRTRIVFNPAASVGYEMGVDAAKMLSTTAPVQIYTLGANTMELYSINERPLTANDELIQLGYYAAYEGDFMLSAERMDTCIVLYDNETGFQVDLSQGIYTFHSKSGYYHDRFTFCTKAKSPEVVTDLNELKSEIWREVNVYNMQGQLVAEHMSIDALDLPQGIYVISNKQNSTKVIVR